ncbi:MAG TPA: hypothetical protein VHU87_05740 [Rhizomicrobium sp.]|jgi:hypothetical protein|nr:hypothetical protein [Rhizomicrobium sp.]
MRKFLVLALALGLTGCGTFSFLSRPPAVFVVFFPDHSTTLTADGQKIVGDAATAARIHGDETIQLTGPSTKVAPGYDPRFAEPRIHAVEAALIADGIDQSRLVRASETTDGINVKSDPSGAQRVEIRLVDKAR